MRISRRASRTTAAVPHASGTPGASALRRTTRTTAAGTALALAALTVAACSSTKSDGSSAPSPSSSVEQAGANANENDIQILNSLQLTTRELDTAFATDNQWQAWTNADMAKLVIKQAQGCTAGIIDTKAQALQPVTTAFKADTLPGDQTAAPSSAQSSPSAPASTKYSTKKGGTPSAPGTTSGTTSSAGPSDGNPAHWVVSTAIAYQSADAARSAVSNMGKIDSTLTSECGGPSDKTPIIGGGIGEVGPSWDNSQGVFVYADTSTKASVAVVAQRRGRYVVLTYTRGGGTQQSGYYDLESGPDTARAADAATGVLGQLTNAVVNRG